MADRARSVGKGLKVVFVGGGSYRIPPIVRAAFAKSPVFRGGEVRLVDLNLARAEAVGRMITRAPEFAGSGCTVSWSNDLDRALKGCDALYVTMAVGSPKACQLSAQASRKHGFLTSDQLSLTGAFLGLTAGPTILGFARKMERICPKALMLIFANPVAVYSGMVNNHTKIKALGLCGGFANHRFDLSRIMGHDEYRDKYDVHAAGVNHMSLILRGTYHGEDLYKVLGRYFKKGWKPPKIHHPSRAMRKHIPFGLRKLEEMYHRFGTIIFSTEGDGMAHLFYEEMAGGAGKPFVALTSHQIAQRVRAAIETRRQADADYLTLVEGRISAADWANHHWLKPVPWDVAIPVFKAMSGRGREKIVASNVNRGAVTGFKDRTVLEYSQIVDGTNITPAGTYEIPDVFHGLISALATFQTLLGDAIATRDPQVLADAFFAYPVKQNTCAGKMLIRELLHIHKDEIPSFCQGAANYL